MGKTLEQRVEELEKRVQELTHNKVVKISKNLGIGDTFELLGLRWKILDIVDGTYKCLAEKLEERMVFDSNSNNWTTSDLREYLNGDFYKKLIEVVGENNVMLAERDLLSLDGQTEYGKCEDNVSLLSFDEYRKYRALIPNTGDYYWWLLTPDSTPCNGDSTWVRVVSSSGGICNRSFNYDYGVRPFVSFSSSIFESEE